MESVSDLTGLLDREAIVSLLSGGSAAEVEQAVADALSSGPYRRVSAELARGFAQTSQTTNMVVDLVDHRTSDWLSRYQSMLVRGLERTTIESLRQALARHAHNLLPVGVTADHVLRTVGLAPRQEQAVWNYRTMLETRDTEVLRRRLGDSRFTIRTMSPEKMDRMTARYAERYLKHRAATIARTEFGRVRNASEFFASQGTGGVRRHWVYVHDDRTRHAHRRIPVLNPDGVGVDEPFESDLGQIMFPGDPSAIMANTINCRCHVELRPA